LVNHKTRPDNVEVNNRGRQRNTIIPYDERYPLEDKFIQKLISKLACPILGTIGSVPLWPKSDTTTVTARQQ